MPRASLTVEETLAILTATPASLAALAVGLSSDRLQIRPSPDDWSANEVLAHLRACADVWGGCIATMLAEDAPTLRAVDPRTWLESTDYRDQPFAASLRAFTAQRADLLATLQSMPPEGWTRSATVTGAGAPLQRTVLTYAQRLARHERPHLKQIERVPTALRK